MDNMNIYKKQNQREMILLLKAQRETYSKAKKVLFSGIMLSTIGTVFFAIFTTIYTSDTVNALSILFSLILLAVNICCGFISNKMKDMGAKIQQTFDVKLFGTQMNFGILNSNEIADVTADYATCDLKEFENWYSDYSNLPGAEQIFHCQQENIRWDEKLRKRYSWFNLVIGIILPVIILLSAIWATVSIFQLFAMLAWAIPIWQYFLGQCKDVYEDIGTLNDLQNEYNSILNNIANYSDCELHIQLTNLQLFIFDHRKKAVLIPNWFYNFYQKKFQAHEDAVASQHNYFVQ